MKKTLGLACAMLLFVTNANALDVGVGAKAGINGLGLDLSVGLAENVNLRFGVTRVDIESEEETVTVGDSGSETDLDAEIDFDYGANTLFVDWHVLGNGFRISAGIFKNNGAAKGSASLQGSTVINGQALAPSDFRGDIDAEISLGESYQPYLGVGWGRGAGGDGGFSLSLDVGVAMLDTSVDFDAIVNSGGANGLTQRQLDRRLAALEDDAESELDEYDLWPVLAIGINYAF